MELEGKRILVVEDEYLIAADLRRSLSDHGAEVVGPAGQLWNGLALARREQFDAAVLDINLEGDAPYPIADLLVGNGVPFLFLTGYDGWSVPDAYAGRPLVAKPYTTELVLQAVRALCAPNRLA